MLTRGSSRLACCTCLPNRTSPDCYDRKPLRELETRYSGHPSRGLQEQPLSQEGLNQMTQRGHS